MSNSEHILAQQVRDTWSRVVGADCTFVLGKEHACPVTINGVTRRFAIWKDSPDGPIKLKLLMQASHGPVFVHYRLKGHELFRTGERILGALSPSVRDDLLRAHEQLFAAPEMQDAPLCDKAAIVDAVLSGLQAAGWTPCPQPSAALAVKVFETAVGPKEAQAYLQDWGSESDVYVLAGNYTSEGRNALATTFGRIPKAVQREELAALVDGFTREADLEVSQTYAAKLLRSRPQSRP